MWGSCAASPALCGAHPTPLLACLQVRRICAAYCRTLCWVNFYYKRGTPPAGPAAGNGCASAAGGEEVVATSRRDRHGRGADSDAAPYASWQVGGHAREQVSVQCAGRCSMVDGAQEEGGKPARQFAPWSYPLHRPPTRPHTHTLHLPGGPLARSLQLHGAFSLHRCRLSLPPLDPPFLVAGPPPCQVFYEHHYAPLASDLARYGREALRGAAAAASRPDAPIPPFAQLLSVLPFSRQAGCGAGREPSQAATQCLPVADPHGATNDRHSRWDCWCPRPPPCRWPGPPSPHFPRRLSDRGSPALATPLLPCSMPACLPQRLAAAAVHPSEGLAALHGPAGRDVFPNDVAPLVDLSGKKWAHTAVVALPFPGGRGRGPCIGLGGGRGAGPRRGPAGPKGSGRVCRRRAARTARGACPRPLSGRQT